jgi:septum formation protein
MFPIVKLLKINKPFVLASKSPRRKKLLEQLGFKLKIIPASINENNIPEDTPPAEYVMQLSSRKAKKVASMISEDSIILGSDTTVVIGGKIINKPQSRDHAFEMLSMLSGNTHKVFTGITLIDTGKNKMLTDFAETDVSFRKLDDDEIWAYIDTGSPMDKAGAYGIQDDFGAVFVSHIVGCYYNIVGLPLEKFYVTLKKLIDEK